ncbi:hypothetical protein FQN50_004818 [Emmonsiellopsis sp. PD_5]|nr:hypothetical protein FQN50_004818 [Emmonsiellopsis sp. PD_5]
MSVPEPARGAAVQLPVINIAEATPAAGKAMIDAATKYGFFYVDSASSQFANEDVDGAFAMAREFFASPYEEKDSVRIGTNRGDFKEAMNFGELLNNKFQQPLPPSLLPHEAELANFMTLCRNTCDRILELLALGLDIPPTFFTTRHDPAAGSSGCTFRLLYYPSLYSPASSTFQHDVDVRAGAHSDYGSITLLFQRDGQPGLEILTPAGEWAPVPVRPVTTNTATGAVGGEWEGKMEAETTFPPILINIGDLLSYWTCGLLKSTVHRVVFPLEEQELRQKQGGNDDDGMGRDRYSMAYFCHPVNNTELVPVPSRLVEEQRKKKKEKVGEGGDQPMTAREHLAGRLAATYGGKKEEYQ